MRLALGLAFSISLVASACGGDGGAPAADDASPLDGAHTGDGGGGDLDASVGADAAPAVDAAAGAPVGAPCVAISDCEGNFCIDDSQGFPGGYCTQTACDLADPFGSCLPFGGDGICLDVGGGVGVCFDQCDPLAPDCRVDYECVDLGGVGICLPAPVCGNGTVERGEECEPPSTPTCDANCQGLGAAPIGDPCASAADCAGDWCITDADGWPLGYCTQLDCDLSDPTNSCLAFGGDGICLDVGDPMMPFGACFDSCDPAGMDCRVDYMCQPIGGGAGVCVPAPVCGNGVVETGEECEPPSTPTCDANCQGLGSAPIGDPCASAADCAGDWCITDADGWPLGYCTELDCDLADPTNSCLPLGGDGVCLDVGDPMTPFGVCFDSCDPAGMDCRVDYMCQPIGGGAGVCVPAPVCGNGAVEAGEECEPPSTPTCDANCQGLGTAPVGDPCVDATECAGNFCLTDADGWPMGYCSHVGCDLADPAGSCLAYGGDGLCIDAGGGTGLCVDQCTPGPGGGCRVGYDCQSIGMGTFICVPM